MKNTIVTFIDSLISFFEKDKTKKLIVIGLLVIATLLRFWKIEYIPMADDADELAYVFAGQSLIKYGEPISWSSFTYPENEWQTMEFDSGTTNKSFKITFIRPWFDHPMLLPMIMGPLSIAAGYEFPSVPPALLFRLPMLIMAIVTLWLVYQLAKHFFGYWPAVFSLAIATGSPALIFIQRMVVGENVVILCLLAALYLFLVKRKLFWSAVIAVVAVQAKLVGVIIVPIIALAMVLENKWKQAIVFGLVTTVVALGIFMATGYGLAGSNFLQAQRNQSYRLLGWSNPASILSDSGFQNYNMDDFSYYVLLILGITGLMFAKKTDATLLQGAVLMLLGLIWVTSAEKDFLGWYKIPLFIVFAISSAGWIAEKKLLLPIMLLGVSIVSNFGLVRYPTNPLPSSEIQRLGVFILLVVLLAILVWVKKTKYQAVILSTLLVLYIVQAGFVTHKYFEGRCTDVSECTVPTVTFSSILKQIL